MVRTIAVSCALVRVNRHHLDEAADCLGDGYHVCASAGIARCVDEHTGAQVVGAWVSAQDNTPLDTRDVAHARLSGCRHRHLFR